MEKNWPLVENYVTFDTVVCLTSTVSKQLCHCINHTALNWDDDSDKWPVLFFFPLCTSVSILLYASVFGHCLCMHCLIHAHTHRPFAFLFIVTHYLLHDFYMSHSILFSCLFLFIFHFSCHSIVFHRSDLFLSDLLFYSTSLFLEQKIQLNPWHEYRKQT